jgi:4-carboxymuconolactone decarboxylase
MNITRVNLVLFLTIVNLLLGIAANAQTKDRSSDRDKWMVRIAKIKVDSAWLKEYKLAIEEHTKAALELESGVLTLYALQDKVHPENVTVLEIYASKEAYQLHIKSAHFIKYKTSTLHMVKSLELIDVDPIALGAKQHLLGELL